MNKSEYGNGDDDDDEINDDDDEDDEEQGGDENDLEIKSSELIVHFILLY